MIPISASCLHRRTVHIHNNLFDSSGEPAVQPGPQTMGLWGSREAVLDTTASDESAVQVLKTTGLPVGGKRLSSRPLPGGESAVQILKTTGLPVGSKRLSSRPLPGGDSAVQVLKTTGLWGSEAVLDTTASDEPAVQVLKTTGLWGSEAVLDTTASDEPAVQVLKAT